MDKLEINIPTLTDIAHQGNEEMLNHFDAHQFEEIEDIESPFSIDDISTLENASNEESAIEIENTELNEIPSITIEDEHNIDIQTEDFSQAMLTNTNNPSDEKNIDNLKQKVDQAIADALPEIEANLKEKLYKTFNI